RMALLGAVARIGRAGVLLGAGVALIARAIDEGLHLDRLGLSLEAGAERAGRALVLAHLREGRHEQGVEASLLEREPGTRAAREARMAQRLGDARARLVDRVIEDVERPSPRLVAFR